MRQSGDEYLVAIKGGQAHSARDWVISPNPLHVPRHSIDNKAQLFGWPDAC
jgi:hypothetical protein